MDTMLQNIVRLGTVSSVDVGKRTARVIFADRDNLVSGELKVLQNQPLITVEKWVMEVGTENKWTYDAAYNSCDRNLGLGETYKKQRYAELKDIIKNEKVIKYEKRETISEGEPIECTCGGKAISCPLQGIIENKKHRQTVTVYPWLPYVGQLVLCLYLPLFNSDGFILGGL